MRNTRRRSSSSLTTFGLCAWLLVAIAAGTGAASAHDAHDVAAVETPPAVRAEGEDLTQSLVRLDAERRRGGAAAAALARQMLDTAAKRADVLAELIADHPAEVLRLALPARLRAPMPAEVQALLEERVEIEGELEVLHIDMPDPAQSRFAYFLTTELGERFSLHFAQGAPKFLTGARVSVDGLLLPRSAPDTGETDGAMAVESGETNVEVLPLDGSGGSGGSSGPVLADTFGEQRTLVIMVNFQDKPSEQPWSAQQANDVVFGQTSDFYLENSFQQTWLTGDVAGWYTIPLDSTGCDYWQISSFSRQAAAAAGYSLSNYDRFIYLFPKNACTWGGLATVGAGESWLNGGLTLRIVAHESGHNYGLYHSAAPDCGAVPIADNCPIWPYGDVFDVMGRPSAGHFNAYQKDRLGWLGFGGSPAITTVGASGTYTLDPYEPSGAAPKALKILKSTDATTGARTWYYLEYRRAVGFDSFLSGNTNVLGGVLIHTGQENDGNTSNLLDMTPNSGSGTDDYNDAALVGGQTLVDPNSGVTITTLAAGGSQASVSVTLSTPTCVPANPQVAVSPPESQWVAPGTPVAYTVTVTNKDGAACANATFALTNAVPGGWTGTYDSTSLTLAPGASGSRSLTVTSPASAADGFYTVTATAMNGTSYAGSATATYVVSNPTANQSPVANNDSAATQSGNLVNIPVLANDTDPDGDALKVASATQGGGGTVVVNADNTLTYTANATFSGTDSFSYSASDGRGGSDTAVVTVSVTAVNYPPAAVNDSATTHAGTPVTIAVLANDSDANGDVLSLTSTSTPAYGTVVVNPDKTVTYTPVSWYVGTDSFTYAIADDKGGTASAPVAVTTTNTAAVAVNDNAATKGNSAMTIRVLTNDYDPDRDPIYVKSVTQGAKGTVKINADNTLTYSPGTRFRGSDSFTYTIGDGRGGIASATVTVTKLR